MTAVTDAIEKHAVGGDADIAICVLPNATVMVASRAAKPLVDLSASVQKKMFRIANEIAILAYEATQAHGTNVLGFDAQHAHYLVVARNEEDGIPLRWNPGKSSPKELTDMANKLKDATWSIGKKDTHDVERPVATETKAAPLRPKPSVEKNTEEPRLVELERPDMRSPSDRSGHDLSDVASEIQTRVRKGPTDEMDYRIKNLTRKR